MPPDLLAEVREDVKVIRQDVTKLATQHVTTAEKLDDHERRLRSVELATTKASVIGALIAAIIGVLTPFVMRMLSSAPPVNAVAQTSPAAPGGYYLVPVQPAPVQASTHP